MRRNPNASSDRETNATLRALRRAARRAQELGANTGTPVYVIQNHRIVDLTKQNGAVLKAPTKPRPARRSS